ncbi:MAG: chromate transporter [Clostridiales bacterium]|nr:chromate transporter [Clostridiales bacterium]
MGKRESLVQGMLSIGFWGYGGGTALIPVIEEELKDSDIEVTSDEFNKDVVVASITPGALPVEIATGVGRQVAGTSGMILSATAMALPGALLTVALVSLLTQISGAMLTWLVYVSIGISAYIVFLLGIYIRSTVKESVQDLPAWGVYLIIALVFLLTGAKNFYKILGLDGSPLFQLSTINVLAIAFFLIFYVGGHWTSRRRWPIALVVSVLYVLRISGWRFIGFDGSLNLIKTVMVLLSFYSMVCYYRDGRNRNQDVTLDVKPLLQDVGAWLLFLAALSVPALVFAQDAPLFIPKALLSAVISFGGGDAYLAVADGIFVADDMITSSEFYNQLVPIVNALPGSILCKTLSGIGYYVGYHVTGTVLGGWMVALTGLACSIASSGLTFIAAFHLYTTFERISFFDLLRRWIRPIIVGLLLSVALSMFYENLSIGVEYDWPPLMGGVVSVAIFALDQYLFSRFHLKKITLLALSGALSLAVGLGMTLI